MATKPTKKKNSTSAPKKRTVRKKKKNKSNLKRNLLILVLSLTLFLFLGAMYYFILNQKRHEAIPSVQHPTGYSTKAMLDDLAKIKTKKPNEVTIVEKSKHINVVEHKPKKVLKEKAPYTERGKVKAPKSKDLKKIEKGVPSISHGKHPKLAIVIDDVHSKKQMNAIKHLGLKITPSIFPPYVLSKHSHLLAKQVRHSMIHLPMESGSRQLNTQTKTLMTSFSDEKIADRVMELRMLFPKTKYINNHTGSVFTSDYKAMKKLYIALRMEGFIFVDSFTKASSKVRKIANELGERYIKRDIFIDNTHSVTYIHKQLEKAVRKAKKRGYAIAIGHPHKVTMKALASAKQILKDVELVYIDEL